MFFPSSLFYCPRLVLIQYFSLLFQALKCRKCEEPVFPCPCNISRDKQYLFDRFPSLIFWKSLQNEFDQRRKHFVWMPGNHLFSPVRIHSTCLQLVAWLQNYNDGSNMCLELALEGERLCKSGDCRAGVAFFQAAIQAGTDDLRTLSAIYSQLGNAYFYLGDYAKAVQYHKHDLTLAKWVALQLWILTSFHYLILYLNLQDNGWQIRRS